ncbi:MAG: 1-deoxy-D-xylulose-5-phosphate reductoisomerase [Clostridia bacterium]|nr:1-deoxy-D-xylulose-5-phosphate reductoisomerase [Clostridia bacterium]
MIKSAAILGSTGSIGRQTISVCKRLGIPVAALTTNKNIGLLEEQARFLRPLFVAAYDKYAAEALRTKLADTDIRVGSGPEGLTEAAALAEADCVVTAVSGSVGLAPTLKAIDAGKRIALANKETLVCAGSLVMARAREKRVDIIPVDSEHSAIFQCLAGRESELSKILLTGSGGPFLGMSRKETENVTPEQAVRHPNWSMGAKISVDSATMMNKGLEYIEAMHLFAAPPEAIEVVIHPESIVHSMVELVDGAVIAQMGMPDMELPIQYALTWPERRASDTARLDLTKLSGLTFRAPDLQNMPCLALAMECAKTGGTAPAILSAANEEAVAMFLGGRIGFNRIYGCVAEALARIEIIRAPELQDILDADIRARTYVKEHFS